MATICLTACLGRPLDEVIQLAEKFKFGYRIVSEVEELETFMTLAGLLKDDQRTEEYKKWLMETRTIAMLYVEERETGTSLGADVNKIADLLVARCNSSGFQGESSGTNSSYAKFRVQFLATLLLPEQPWRKFTEFHDAHLFPYLVSRNVKDLAGFMLHAKVFLINELRDARNRRRVAASPDNREKSDVVEEACSLSKVPQKQKTSSLKNASTSMGKLDPKSTSNEFKEKQKTVGLPKKFNGEVQRQAAGRDLKKSDGKNPSVVESTSSQSNIIEQPASSAALDDLTEKMAISTVNKKKNKKKKNKKKRQQMAVNQQQNSVMATVCLTACLGRPLDAVIQLAEKLKFGYRIVSEVEELETFMTLTGLLKDDQRAKEYMKLLTETRKMAMLLTAEERESGTSLRAEVKKIADLLVTGCNSSGFQGESSGTNSSNAQFRVQFLATLLLPEQPWRKFTEFHDAHFFPYLVSRNVKDLVGFMLHAKKFIINELRDASNCRRVAASPDKRENTDVVEEACSLSKVPQKQKTSSLKNASTSMGKLDPKSTSNEFKEKQKTVGLAKKFNGEVQRQAAGRDLKKSDGKNPSVVESTSSLSNIIEQPASSAALDDLTEKMANSTVNKKKNKKKKNKKKRQLMAVNQQQNSVAEAAPQDDTSSPRPCSEEFRNLIAGRYPVSYHGIRFPFACLLLDHLSVYVKDLNCPKCQHKAPNPPPHT